MTNFKPDALLFDFDGVLADTEPLHYRAWSETLAPLGISVSWEFYVANCVGVADDALFSNVFPKVFSVANPAKLVDAKRTAYRASLELKPPFLASTLELVRELSGQYPLAVVSSSSRAEVEPPLVRAGIAQYFRRMITREDVERIKPNPEPYLKAARWMDAKNPLVIEDSSAGIAAGKAAGFRVVEISSAASMASELRAALARKLA